MTDAEEVSLAELDGWHPPRPAEPSEATRSAPVNEREIAAIWTWRGTSGARGRLPRRAGA